MIPRTLLSVGIVALSSTPTLALVHQGPRATDTVADDYEHTGWTPKPTPAPLLSGSLSELKKKKRQDTLLALSETCGWYSGDPNSPFSCETGNACAFNTGLSYFGCCSTDATGYLESSDCAYIATPSSSCIDYTLASLCDDACYATNYVCDEESPYCATALLDDGNGLVLRHYACLTVSAITFILETTTTNDAAPSTIIITAAPSAASSSSVLPNTPTANSTQSSNTAITTPTSNGSSSPHKSDVGAIAGGVVGGSALLAMAAVAAIFFLRKKKKDQRKSIMPEVSQM